MKKLLPCALVAVFALSMIGCETKKDPPKTDTTTPTTTTPPADPAKK